MRDEFIHYDDADLPAPGPAAPATVSIVRLEQTCTACPSQWEGSLEDGRYLYVRFRHGHLSAGAGPTERDAVLAGDADSDGTELLYREVGDDLSGFMTEAQMLGYLAAAGIGDAR